MHYRIVSEISGRLRLRCGAGIFDEGEARGVAYALMRVPGVRHAEVHEANGSVLIVFDPTVRDSVIQKMDSFTVLDLPSEEVGMEPFCNQIEVATENNRFALGVCKLVVWRILRRVFLPAPLRILWTIIRGAGYVWKAIKQLARGKLTVEVLDGTAILATLLLGNFSEAANVMMLLQLSSLMEDHVRSRAHLALKNGLVTRSETIWRVEDGQDVQISIDEVNEGDVLHLGAGSVLPVDGEVVAGEGEIDESSMTGESRLVHKHEGSVVYAGTALEDGDLQVRVTQAPGNARIDHIVTMVEQSQGLKASAQSRAEQLADSLVPYSFLAFFAILAITRNIGKAMAVLMVDYSCAIRLSMPIAVMSAMDEASSHGMVVKGGKYLEAFASADTIAFDKTGTLTHASPKVERVIPFAGLDEGTILRYAACAEEHFPHSMARAIVDEAARRGLSHVNELHAKVDYVVAHGISTTINGAEVRIGSAHFLFGDEGIDKPQNLEQIIEEQAPTASVVYASMDGKLIGAICISDPLRDEAASVLARLRGLGVTNMVMLTGDSQACAAYVARELNLDEYRAQVLPEDKSTYVKQLKDEGHTVIMVGDGINDSPALAEADVSVAMSDASDIARAVADVSVLDTTLESLVTMRVLSQRLMNRIQADYRFIMGYNSTLIVLGVASVIPVATAAYAHNIGTFAISALNTRKLLKSGE